MPVRRERDARRAPAPGWKRAASTRPPPRSRARDGCARSSPASHPSACVRRPETAQAIEPRRSGHFRRAGQASDVQSLGDVAVPHERVHEVANSLQMSAQELSSSLRQRNSLQRPVQQPMRSSETLDGQCPTAERHQRLSRPDLAAKGSFAEPRRARGLALVVESREGLRVPLACDEPVPDHVGATRRRKGVEGWRFRHQDRHRRIRGLVVVRLQGVARGVGLRDQAPVRIGARARRGERRSERVGDAGLARGAARARAVFQVRLRSIDEKRRPGAGILPWSQPIEDRDRIVGPTDHGQDPGDLLVGVAGERSRPRRSAVRWASR